MREKGANEIPNKMGTLTSSGCDGLWCRRWLLCSCCLLRFVVGIGLRNASRAVGLIPLVEVSVAEIVVAAVSAIVAVAAVPVATVVVAVVVAATAAMLVVVSASVIHTPCSILLTVRDSLSAMRRTTKIIHTLRV